MLQCWTEISNYFTPDSASKTEPEMNTPARINRLPTTPWVHSPSVGGDSVMKFQSTHGRLLRPIISYVIVFTLFASIHRFSQSYRTPDMSNFLKHACGNGRRTYLNRAYFNNRKCLLRRLTNSCILTRGIQPNHGVCIGSRANDFIVTNS